jgi:glucose dehydrogenase
MLRGMPISPRSVVWFVLFGQIWSSRITLAQTADWPQFGWDVTSSGANALSGINAHNLGALTRRQIQIDGTVDASAIYLHGVTVNNLTHDLFFVTTTYGKTIAIDGNSGDILWEYTPPQYTAWVGTAQITTSTPAADPDRQYIRRSLTRDR